MKPWHQHWRTSKARQQIRKRAPDTGSDQPEELIYEVTKALWNDNTRKLLNSGHAKGKVIRLETALTELEGLDVPLHPGVTKTPLTASVLTP